MLFLIRTFVKHCIQLCNLLSFLCCHIPDFDFDIPFDLLADSVFLNFSKKLQDWWRGESPCAWCVSMIKVPRWPRSCSHPSVCWQTLFTRELAVELWMQLAFYLLTVPSRFYFNVWVRKVKVKVAQLCLTLCDPVDWSLPGSCVHGILQARILEWVAISFSRGSSRPRNWTQVSCTAGRFFTFWTTREAPCWARSHMQITWEVVQNDPASYP